jgi:hypothetical protein
VPNAGGESRMQSTKDQGQCVDVLLYPVHTVLPLVAPRKAGGTDDCGRELEHAVQAPESMVAMLYVFESAFRVSVTHRQYPSRGRRRRTKFGL